jgi:transposase-like protein
VIPINRTVEKASRDRPNILETKKMQRKKHSAEFKAKIALEALKNLRTINEIASKAQVHATQVNQWVSQLSLP